MRLLSRCVLPTVLACLFILGSGGQATAAGDAVARVGHLTISKYELGREFQKILPLSGSFHGGVSAEKIQEIREEALNKLVDRYHKVLYAFENEISVDNADVEAAYHRVRGKFPSDEEFAKALGGESPAAFRASIFRELLAAESEKVAVDDQIMVTDKEVLAYYEKNRERYFRPHQFRASHILIRVDPASTKEEKAQARERAEDLLKQARAGEDFYNLAYYNSDDRTKFVGGDIGLFHEGQTVPEFETAIKGLEVGQVSDIVQTLYGFHIIKLTEDNPPRQLEFDEVKARIRGDFESERREARYNEWMGSLREKYPVERLD